MQNWCMNSLVIRGNDSEVREVVDGLNRNGISAFLPTPKELEKIAFPAEEYYEPEILEKYKKEYGAADWKEWRYKNWGTKWDIEAFTELESDDGFALITFETASTPIVEALKKISEMYPSLVFDLEYEEPETDLFGKVIFRNGKLSQHFKCSWENRFCEAWWQFQELQEKFEQADIKLNEMLKNKTISKEEYKKILDKFNNLNNTEASKLLSILNKEDVEKIKSFAN